MMPNIRWAIERARSNILCGPSDTEEYRMIKDILDKIQIKYTTSESNKYDRPALLTDGMHMVGLQEIIHGLGY